MVKITNLRIDRFGVCSDVQLDSLSDQLNTIYGAPGAGDKATIVQFIRAVFYGFDETIRRRYLPNDSRGAGGAITVIGQYGRRTISRYDDGSVQGRLTVQHDDGTLIGRSHVQDLLADVPQTVFDRVFVVDFEQRPRIGELIDEAVARGFDLLEREGVSPRLQASEFLRRLSGDNLREIQISGASHVWLVDQNGHRLAYQQLGPAVRDQVYLSLCLAIAQGYGRRGVHLPLVLNEGFADSGSINVPQATELLRDFARWGHQVLLFTSREQVAKACRSLDAMVRHLEGSPPGPGRSSNREPSEASEKKGQTPYILHSKTTWKGVNPFSQQPPAVSECGAAEERPANALPDGWRSNDPATERQWDSEEFPGELTDRVRLPSPAADVRQRPPELGAEKERTPFPSDFHHCTTSHRRTPNDYGNGVPECWLCESDPIEDVPTIGAADAARLRKIGVSRVGDLLDAPPSGAVAELRHAGVTVEMVQSWQAHALLLCRIPHLRPYDARVLVACGITAPEQLARTKPHGLRSRVKKLADSSDGRTILRSGTLEELSRVAGWINAARRSPTGRAAGSSVKRRAA